MASCSACTLHNIYILQVAIIQLIYVTIAIRLHENKILCNINGPFASMLSLGRSI